MGAHFIPTPPEHQSFLREIGSEIQSASLMYADGNCYLRVCYLYVGMRWRRNGIYK